jgi:hypothetical protein
MPMLFGHAARETLPMKKSLNGRSLERLRSLYIVGYDVDCWRHTYLHLFQRCGKEDVSTLPSARVACSSMLFVRLARNEPHRRIPSIARPLS